MSAKQSSQSIPGDALLEKPKLTYPPSNLCRASEHMNYMMRNAILDAPIRCTVYPAPQLMSQNHLRWGIGLVVCRKKSKALNNEQSPGLSGLQGHISPAPPYVEKNKESPKSHAFTTLLSDDRQHTPSTSCSHPAEAVDLTATVDELVGRQRRP